MLNTLLDRLRAQLPATLRTNVVGNSIAKSRGDLARTPSGSPPVDCDVRSVYDVRPVGGYDFGVTISGYIPREG